MPMIEGASNFTISGYARLYEVHGNAVIDSITDNNELKKFLSIVNLPRAQASQKDYETSKKSGLCFPGTREALLREMMEWTNETGDTRMYVLSGLAGIGKSTVAYTVATQADELGLLAASFFFSRDEDDRKNARRFFNTIAYQLCVYDEMFAKAIGDALLTERGSAAATQNPQEQLKVLILDPLRRVIQSRSRPTLIVVDALDECDEEDVFSVLAGLNQLVRDLLSFKVILTTRPLDDLVLRSQSERQILHLQDIEDKIVDSDIRLYLQHSLSLEQVQRCYPRWQWCASDEEVDFLVHAAGRLFTIASTAVRYILDRSASDPAAQMQKLLLAFAQDHTSLSDLDHLYTIMLRDVVPENCDDHIVSRYQSVVGAIISVQRPLPVSTLADLINIDVDDIHAVLDQLQSVILLDGYDVPRIYHHSFHDYLTDQARCKDPRLRIDTSISRSTQIAARCFEIMNKHLKRNILGLGDPARYMSNEDGIKEDRITDEQLQEKIPRLLRYACVYWVNHLEVANIEDANLMNGLEMFAYDYMLYWFEVLSLIGKLDSAQSAIGVVLKLLPSTSSHLHQLLSDALHFVSMFYEIIKRSALHMYYSALSFTPPNSLLYRRYVKEAENSICSIEGGPEKWDALAAKMNHGEPVDIIKFSLDSALFASWSENSLYIYRRREGKLTIWDAATSTPISTISGHTFAVANDFSTVASFEDKTITFYNVNGSTRTMFTTSSRIEKLALSSKSSRAAAALADGTVWLWDSENAELIDNFDGFEENTEFEETSNGLAFSHWFQIERLQFCPTGARIAYSSADNITLRDGISGRSIANLPCGSSHKFEFSGDGSRIASVSLAHRMMLWNSATGGLIASVAVGVGRHGFGISANGSLLATVDDGRLVLWNDSLAQIKVLESASWKLPIAFSLDNILAIEIANRIKLYNVKTQSFVHTLPHGRYPKVLAFSPDCTRLAVSCGYEINLWDIRHIGASGSEAAPVSALALSRDCSRLACGFGDGAVELLGTSPTKRRIGPLALHLKMEATFSRIFRQSRHTDKVAALAFSPDGRLFASGSDDETIKLWNGGDGALRGTINVLQNVRAVALSNSVLVAAWSIFQLRGGVTLWSLDTLRPIRTFNYEASKVSIAENSTIIALFFPSNHFKVTLLDVVNRTTIATFYVPSDIHTMTFLPDNSQLIVQSDDGVFLSLNFINKRIREGPTLKYLMQLPNTPLWRGFPIWHCQNKEQHYFSALFSPHKRPVPMLWIPKQIPVTVWTEGSSIIVLGCEDGRVILLGLPTSHFS